MTQTWFFPILAKNSKDIKDYFKEICRPSLKSPNINELLRLHITFQSKQFFYIKIKIMLIEDFIYNSVISSNNKKCMQQNIRLILHGCVRFLETSPKLQNLLLCFYCFTSNFVERSNPFLSTVLLSFWARRMFVLTAFAHAMLSWV